MHQSFKLFPSKNKQPVHQQSPTYHLLMYVTWCLFSLNFFLFFRRVTSMEPIRWFSHERHFTTKWYCLLYTRSVFELFASMVACYFDWDSSDSTLPSIGINRSKQWTRKKFLGTGVAVAVILLHTARRRCVASTASLYYLLLRTKESTRRSSWREDTRLMQTITCAILDLVGNWCVVGSTVEYTIMVRIILIKSLLSIVAIG